MGGKYVKASICTLAAVLLGASPGLALSAPAKATVKPATSHHHHRTRHAAKVGDQTYASGRCKVTIPRTWTDSNGAKADPKDREFSVTLGGASNPKSLAATIKAMRGRTVSETPAQTLMKVDLRVRGATQYWAISKPAPGCRATVTFSDASQEAAARKIVESLQKAR
jgi:hypothetical protein